MESLIVIFMFGAACFYCGWKLREVHARRIMDRMVDEISERTIQEFKSSVVNISIEDYDGQFFVYNKEDGSYLAHAETKSKLEDILQEKFPGKYFNATPEDLQKMESR